MLNDALDIFLTQPMCDFTVEDSTCRQILTELLRVIGVSSFNHLLMRKNFCTWKRGKHSILSFSMRFRLPFCFRRPNTIQCFPSRRMVYLSRHRGSHPSSSTTPPSCQTSHAQQDLSARYWDHIRCLLPLEPYANQEIIELILRSGFWLAGTKPEPLYDFPFLTPFSPSSPCSAFPWAPKNCSLTCSAQRKKW